ncbi:organic cation transporter protein-like [Pararge aegeria]|uniref:organic cation transporter protein-like n=1 Tax=Pararge aegeria TaxID=116150 RepID=UPI0019D10E8F|nr:organic cation transporter protein-like [Pararge aegeria]
MDVVKVVDVKKVDLDLILNKFGLAKRYHIQMISLIMLAMLCNGMYTMNYVFAAEEVSYRCKEDLDNNSHCNPSNSSHKCSEWVYGNPDSFFAYFELACQEWKRTLVGTVHSAGYMCGLLLIGPMSDRFGRKPIAIIAGVLGAIFGILRSFSVWYWFYIALEFVEGAIGDNISPMCILTLESISTRKKLYPFMFANLGFVAGGVTLAMVAWLTPNWRWFLRVIYIPAFLFLTYKCYLDESPRWLLTKGKKDDAITILKNAAKKNKIEIDKESLENLTCEVNEKVSFAELLKQTFKSKELRKRFFVCIIWWTTSTFVNYGLMINSVSLQGNKYVNFILAALVDFPGIIIATYLLINFRRKLPLMLSFFAGAVLCTAQPFLPTDLPWLSILFYMAGKLMCAFFFYITYVYTAELFPTYTRNSMHALCSSIGRVGSIVAPQTPLLRVHWAGLPSFVFGVAALIAGLCTLLVPDVAEDALPDTVRQAEALGTSNKAEVVVGQRVNTQRLSSVAYAVEKIRHMTEVEIARCKDDLENNTHCKLLNSSHACSEWVYDDPDSFFAYRVYWNGLPSFIFGVAAFTAGLSTLLVPDVANNVLPDTVH